VDSKHLPNSSQGEIVSKKRCSDITIIVHCFKGMSCTVKLVQAHTDLWLRHKMLIQVESLALILILCPA